MKTYLDQAYRTDADADSRHRLDLYLPQDVQSAPLLMMVSGGGWSSGDKNWVAGIGKELATRGIAVATVEHRLQPQHTLDEQVGDLAAALGWLVDNAATYDIDPERIFVGGHSAGAHLTSLLALDGRRLQAVGLSAAVIKGVVAVALASSTHDVTDNRHPITHISAQTPPMLLVIGKDDSPRLMALSAAMTSALSEAQRPVKHHVLPTFNHFNIIEAPRLMQLMAQFIQADAAT